jgi:hypothetical protein
MTFGEILSYRALIVMCLSASTAFLSSAALARQITYRQAMSDVYEEDNSFEEASIIVVDEVPQRHDFHEAADEDWVKFLARAGVIYEIKTSDAGSNCDTVIELYDVDGRTRLDRRDDRGSGEDEAIRGWSSAQDGIYYAKISQSDPDDFGADTAYNLTVVKEGSAPFQGILNGTITETVTGNPVENAQVRLGTTGSAISDSDGHFLLIEKAGTYKLEATAFGYERYEKEPVTLAELVIVSEDIALVPTVAADAKVNNLDGPLDVIQTEGLSLTVACRAGGLPNQMADWWLVADTPAGWFYFDLPSRTWQSGVVPTYQGLLFELHSVEVPMISERPVGTYVFYFGIDLERNGAVDQSVLYFDKVEVNIR